MLAPHYDIVILGSGLAGLSLARQTLLRTDKKILLLDRSAEVPTPRQKVGESTVQVGGYYLSKVLDLEEYLLREHFLKYNLRFYWRRPDNDGSSYEDYDHCYIRTLSNIAGYQVNRNTLEAELLRLNRENPNCTFCAPVHGLDVALNEDGPHALRFSCKGRQHDVSATWVVDATGRGKLLARRMDLTRSNPIRHGASFVWVDGLVNVEKLTHLSLDQVLLRKDRRMTGHFPMWLATNHFVGEGFWFWVIPLQGKTSLGVVYDRALFPAEEVDTPEKLIHWVCREFPLFRRDLSKRKILDHGLFRDFSYDCEQTINSSRWALTGESGRFSDPLYSPGSDLIAFHNTLILDAILTDDPQVLREKAQLYETLARSLYQAYVPSYAVSYDVLGDQEAFILKYAWELTVYFTFFVFPFINQLFTKRDFILPYLSKLARLGRINSNLQALISAFYQWKKVSEPAVSAAQSVLFDFTQIGPLKLSESLFYRVAESPESALELLDLHLENLRQLGRFIVAHVASRVLRVPEVVGNRAFVEAIRLNEVTFEPASFRTLWERCSPRMERYDWLFDAHVLDLFHRHTDSVQESNRQTHRAELAQGVASARNS